MMTSDLDSIVNDIRAALRRIDPSRFAYPLGVNEVRDPSGNSGTRPDGSLDLKDLYRCCDGMELPDVHVGYFIDRAERVDSAAARGEPVRIEPGRVEVRVFGSDGGGGRFAMRLADGSVLYLPSSGMVREGVFFEDARVKARVLAPSVKAFLERLRRDVDAFVAGDDAHEFVVR